MIAVSVPVPPTPRDRDRDRDRDRGPSLCRTLHTPLATLGTSCTLHHSLAPLSPPSFLHITCIMRLWINGMAMEGVMTTLSRYLFKEPNTMTATS